MHGYWIKTNTSEFLNITGSEVENSTAINLETGWNLVSYLPENPDSITHALGSIIEKAIVVLGFDEGGLTYDPDWPQFSNLQILSPDFGYWIKVTEACILVYPDVQVGTTKMMKRTTHLNMNESVNPTCEWINVFSQNALSLGTVIQAKDPGGTICGAYTITDDGFLCMMPAYRDDPETEIDEGAEPGDTIDFYLDGIKIKNSIIWGNFGDVHQLVLEIDAENVPETFQLSQNYPNPFNPMTTLQFNVAESGKVSINVYNLAGRFVKNLYNGYCPRGYHSIRWGGDNHQGSAVATGIYFCVFRFNGIRKIVKMQLIR